MIEIAYADWIELGFRWLHLIAGIAWIGSSFYFMFLDYSLRKDDGLPSGVSGVVPFCKHNLSVRDAIFDAYSGSINFFSSGKV